MKCSHEDLSSSVSPDERILKISFCTLLCHNFHNSSGCVVNTSKFFPVEMTEHRGRNGQHTFCVKLKFFRGNLLCAFDFHKIHELIKHFIKSKDSKALHTSIIYPFIHTRLKVSYIVATAVLQQTDRAIAIHWCHRALWPPPAGKICESSCLRTQWLRVMEIGFEAWNQKVKNPFLKK